MSSTFCLVCFGANSWEGDGRWEKVSKKVVDGIYADFVPVDCLDVDVPTLLGTFTP